MYVVVSRERNILKRCFLNDVVIILVRFKNMIFIPHLLIYRIIEYAYK